MGTTKFNGLPAMQYKSIRKELQTGDLLLCSGNYVVSKMIQEFSGSIFSHVAFIFCWNDRVMVLESVEDDGVRAVPLSQYVADFENSGKPYNGDLFIARHKKFAEEGTSRQEVESMLGRAADLLNKKYDREELFKIARRIMGLGGSRKDNDSYICSEFVDECYKQLSIDFPRDARGFIYPEHIAADEHVTALYRIVS